MTWFLSILTRLSALVISLAQRTEDLWPFDRKSLTIKQWLIVFAHALALVATTVLVWLVISTPGTGPISQTSRFVLWAVVVNLILLLALAFIAARSVYEIAKQRSKDAGSRLHLRFVALFSLAAVTPAIVVALSISILYRGIDGWFSDRVKASVENGASIAKIYIQSEQDTAEKAMTYVKQAIETDQARQLYSDRLAFGLALLNTMELRGQLSAVYLVDSNGQILAQAETSNAPSYRVPPREVIENVRSDGPAAYVYPGPDTMRVFFPINGYGQAVLYGVRSLPDGIVERLQSASASISDYRETSTNQHRAQIIFALAYFETVLMVMIIAVWMAMSAAESIAVPVARLVQAADRVADGDLSARVITTQQSEDIAVLSRAFNRMTSDLQSQQLALKSAGEEAEARRRFIETVLSEISAGIIGLDPEYKISAINRKAAQFLGVMVDEALGKAVLSLVPEIAPTLLEGNALRAEEQELDLTRNSETRRLRVRLSILETGGAVLTFDDLTRLVNAQRNAAWKDVARRIAHEIKNPLTPIQLSAERIVKKYRSQIDTDLDTFDRCTDTIIRQVGDIGRMVDEFASFARMPSPIFSEENIVELIRSAVFAQRVGNPEIKIDLIEGPVPIMAVCDGRMISQALGNVLKNGGEAIMAKCLKEQRKIQDLDGALRVEWELLDDFIKIHIEDNGIGLPEKDRSRLVEPYVTTREKGTGLGLAIVTRILEEHNGEFLLSDAKTLTGARVSIKLPIRVPLIVQNHDNSKNVWVAEQKKSSNEGKAQ